MSCFSLPDSVQNSSTEEVSSRCVNLKRKLKFSLSGSRLDEMCIKLRTLNDDLQRLSSQILRISERESYETKSLQMTSKLEKYREIAAASEGLHQALQKACTKHTTHTAYLSVSTYWSTAAQIHFNLSFTHLSITTKRVGSLHWFNVGFTATSRQPHRSEALASGSDKSLLDLTHTLKRQRSPPIPQTPKKFRKNAKYPTPPDSESSATSEPSSTATIFEGSIPQLCTRRNFCDRIKHCFELGPGDIDAPIGLLDQCKEWKQIVYPSSKKPGHQPTTSLAELVSLLSQGSSRLKLPKRDRIRFARLLATAVLQFYKTP